MIFDALAPRDLADHCRRLKRFWRDRGGPSGPPVALSGTHRVELAPAASGLEATRELEDVVNLASKHLARSEGGGSDSRC